jgi:hypothetical protein
MDILSRYVWQTSQRSSIDSTRCSQLYQGFPPPAPSLCQPGDETQPRIKNKICTILLSALAAAVKCELASFITVSIVYYTRFYSRNERRFAKRQIKDRTSHPRRSQNRAHIHREIQAGNEPDLPSFGCLYNVTSTLTSVGTPLKWITCKNINSEKCLRLARRCSDI